MILCYWHYCDFFDASAAGVDWNRFRLDSQLLQSVLVPNTTPARTNSIDAQSVHLSCTLPESILLTEENYQRRHAIKTKVAVVRKRSFALHHPQ
jgi:hypothetical protein